MDCWIPPCRNYVCWHCATLDVYSDETVDVSIVMQRVKCFSSCKNVHVRYALYGQHFSDNVTDAVNEWKIVFCNWKLAKSNSVTALLVSVVDFFLKIY